MKDRHLNVTNDWRTPKTLYDSLDKEFHFDFDPCPLHSTVDYLEKEWGNSNFINPPYSKKAKMMFVKKGIEESKKGKKCVFLLPVSTSTVLFHDYILPNISEPIRFIRGRVCFEGINSFGQHVTDKNGMHDSMIVIF